MLAVQAYTGMLPIYPDIEWYTKISSAKDLSPRCPYAAAARCPRYYQSLYLLGHAGSTQINEEDDRKLEAFWKNTDLWPLTMEQESMVSGPSDGAKTFTHFCPEVLYKRFGLFASDLIPYPDEESKDAVLNRLAGSGNAFGKDWRWDWYGVHELHFSECPLFSLLPYALPEKRAVDSDGELLEMKPSVGGFSLDLKVLLTRLARWWLKKQKRNRK